MDHRECWCEFAPTFEEGVNDFETLIRMNYEGMGIWRCPKCNEISDMSKDTYKVRLHFTVAEPCGDPSEIEGYPITNIIEPFDERLLRVERGRRKPDWEILQEELGEMDDDFKRHPRGIYDTEILWYYEKCTYEYNDYDMILEIEKKEKVE